LACSEAPRAYAGRVQSRADLVGGPRAIGEVGDWRISNGRVRFIVQDKGASRVYTTFGGSLIDADLERGAGVPGRDGLGEMFPAYFLSAVEPKDTQRHAAIEVVDDGSGGGTARIRVIGSPSEFLTSTKRIDDILIGNGVSFALDYALGPEDDFLTITSTIINDQPTAHPFPSGAFPVPMGFIALFGDGQPLFLPGEAGYDVRFTLEKTFKRKYALPAIPGLTTDVVGVEGDGIAYGLSYCPACASPFANSLPPAPGFVANHASQYSPYAAISPQTMLVPFISGTLLGLFLGEAPQSLPGGTAFSTTLRLRVSDSLSRVIDPVLRETKSALVHVDGVVREERSEEPVAFADVIVTGEEGNSATVSAARADSQGRFQMLLPPGKYAAYARRKGFANSGGIRFDATADAHLEPHVNRNALLAVEVADFDTGRRVPAKVTVEGTYDAQFAGIDPKNFLYNYRLGDPYKPTELDVSTRHYIETTLRAGGDGRALAEVRPDRYRVIVSRGPSYSIDVQDVELRAGELTRVGATVRRVVPAAGRIAADLHVHAQGSVDSDVTLEERALGYAAEGIDFMAMTEHNFVQDLQPLIDRMGLTDFLRATPGIELTSLEAGHWNAYPLQFDVANVTHGSFPWFRRTPQALFDDLRARGKYGPGEVIVQVNHPRDSIQGYFTAYGLSGDALSGNLLVDAPGKPGTFAPSGPGFGPGTFSLDFDAIEILTGKRFDLLRTFRVPDPPPPPPHPPDCSVSNVPGCMGPPGSVVRDGNGAVGFPGALEDWEHLLDTGHRITAVGNSDSHKTLDGEGGYPRNLIDLGHDVVTAREIDEREVVRAIKAGRVSVTTGPVVTLTAITDTGEVPAGSLVKPDSAGAVRLHVVVDAAPWIDVSDVQLIVPVLGAPVSCFRGDPCSRMKIALDSPGEVRRLDRRDLRVLAPAGRDSWVAVEVRGQRSLWPVVIPYEIPVLLLNDAVAAVGGALGLTDPFGNLKPRLVTQTYPFAVSNPILIDGDLDGKWGAPPQRGPVSRVRLDGSGDDAQLMDLRAAVERWRR
jgi:hypothetical protein